MKSPILFVKWRHYVPCHQYNHGPYGLLHKTQAKQWQKWPRHKKPQGWWLRDTSGVGHDESWHQQYSQQPIARCSDTLIGYHLRHLCHFWCYWCNWFQDIGEVSVCTILPRKEWQVNHWTACPLELQYGAKDVVDLLASEVEDCWEHQPEPLQLSLDKGICHTLAETPKALQRKSWSALWTASECSLSPILEFDCVWNWKHATVEAIEDATWAIANWYNNSLQSESFDHLNKLMEKKYYRQQSEMFKMKYNDAKHNFSGKMFQ